MNQNEIAPFHFDFEGHRLRVIMIDDKPWWVLTEVCRALGMGTQSNAARRLDGDEKGSYLVHTPGGPQEMVIINESGLYRVILTSRQPGARRFTKWVTGEVLPTIRKHGAYIDPAAANPAYIIEQMAKMIAANNLLQAAEWDRRAAIEDQRRLKHEERVGELLDSHDPSIGRRKKQKTMLEIVISYGVVDKKDRAKLTRALSAGMTRWCRRHAIMVGETAERATILYPVEVIDEWYREEGKVKIDAHKARVSGQTVFDFSDEKRKREKPAAPTDESDKSTTSVNEPGAPDATG